MERWKKILEGRYEVSNLGQIRSAKGKYKGKILVQYGCNNNKDRYKFVEVHINKKKKILKIHRVVASKFCKNSNNYPIVMHLDNNPKNNAASNLQWGTLKMNSEQRSKENRVNAAKGSKHTNSKLTELQVSEIRRKYKPKDYTLCRLAREYNVSHGLIYNIVKMKAWKHLKHNISNGKE